MTKFFVTACVLSLAPLIGHAGGLNTPAQPVLAAPAPAPASPDLVFNLRGGITGMPAYFGADSYVPGADFALGFEFLRLPGGGSFGNANGTPATGFVPRGSFRVIRERSAADHAELSGMDDVGLAVEMGLGVAYKQRNFQLFADARYGVIGHRAWVGELGGDLIASPSDRLKLTVGPRLFLADTSYAGTYFGVTAAESAASGLAAFSPEGGALSAGVEAGATYALNDDWGIAGAVRWDRLLNDAAASPITGLGSADQFSVRIGLTRRFTIDF